MIRRVKFWLAADAVFILSNIVGGVAAIGRGEFRHAGTHLVLVMIGAAVAWFIAPRNGALPAGESSAEFEDGLTRLQQSLDAVALEVERIGEGQRYVTQLFGETSRAREATSHEH
jgi:hypothetical protein